MNELANSIVVAADANVVDSSNVLDVVDVI